MWWDRIASHRIRLGGMGCGGTIITCNSCSRRFQLLCIFTARACVISHPLPLARLPPVSSAASSSLRTKRSSFVLSRLMTASTTSRRRSFAAACEGRDNDASNCRCAMAEDCFNGSYPACWNGQIPAQTVPLPVIVSHCACADKLRQVCALVCPSLCLFLSLSLLLDNSRVVPPLSVVLSVPVLCAYGSRVSTQVCCSIYIRYN